MGKDDNDEFDAAFDRAYEKLEDTAESESTSDAVEESVSEADGSGESSHEGKEAESTEGARSRDDRGRFAKGAKTAETPIEGLEEQSSGQVAKSEEPTAQEGDAEGESHSDADPEQPSGVPEFWPAGLKGAAAEAKSPDARKLLAAFREHDVQRENWARQVATESQRGKALEQRLNSDFSSREEFERHRALMGAQGVRDEVEELHRYRAWNRLQFADPVLAISDLMRRAKLTPEDFLEDAGAFAPRAEGELPPEYQQRLQQFDERFAAIESHFTEQEQKATNHAVFEWGKGIDSTGQQKGPIARLYSLQIDAEVGQLRQLYPHASLEQCLDAAYERVVGEARRALGITSQPAGQAPRRDVRQIAANTAKVKAAASSVKGGPNSVVQPQRPRIKGSSFEEQLDSAVDNAERAVGRS